MERSQRSQADVQGANVGSQGRAAERRETGGRPPTPPIDLAQIINAMSSILIAMDPGGTVTLWSRGAERTLGVCAAKTIGRPLVECPVRWNPAPLGRALDACRDEGTPQRVEELRYTRVDGSGGVLGITISLIRGEGGEQRGILLLGADITERRALTNQLAHVQKLESIGRLAAGIAHEINTPIQYIGDNLRFMEDSWNRLAALLGALREALRALRDGTADTDAVLANLEAVLGADTDYVLQEVPMAIADALDGAGRVSEIVRAMREFAHPATANKSAIDVNRAIQSTITVARSEWKDVAEVRTDLDPDLPLVPCLPAEFNQAVLNILINAVHAIADLVGDGARGKGVITVSTHAAGPWAELRIGDTGTGIPADVQDRVFDPFFTTKEVGRGTGQGLAIAHSIIVEKHGGTITFDTEPGKGTTFVIRLPIECDAIPKGTVQ